MIAVIGWAPGPLWGPGLAVNAMTANAQTIVFIIVLLASVKNAPECGSESEEMHRDGDGNDAGRGDGKEEF